MCARPAWLENMKLSQKRIERKKKRKDSLCNKHQERTEHNYEKRVKAKKCTKTEVSYSF